MTFHDKPDATRLQVFEGFMDFLSYLSKDKPTQPVGAVPVLNTTNLWPRALPFLNDKDGRVRLYLDNDAAGDAATRKLFENVASKLADMRSYYAGYEDLNVGLRVEKFRRFALHPFQNSKEHTTGSACVV